MAMPEWLADTAPWVAIVGGVVGLLGGGLGIYYASTANATLLRRLRREDAQYELEADKDALWQAAYEQAHSVQGGSTHRAVLIDLKTARERRAAWALAKEGRATVRGTKCEIWFDTMPPLFRKALQLGE